MQNKDGGCSKGQHIWDNFYNRNVISKTYRKECGLWEMDELPCTNCKTKPDSDTERVAMLWDWKERHISGNENELRNVTWNVETLGLERL